MEHNTHIKEAIDNLVTELMEKSLAEKRKDDETFRQNIGVMNNSIKEFEEKYLEETEKEEFEEVKNLIYSYAREESTHLYIQGIKDGISLLKEIGVIR